MNKHEYEKFRTARLKRFETNDSTMHSIDQTIVDQFTMTSKESDFITVVLKGLGLLCIIGAIIAFPVVFIALLIVPMLMSKFEGWLFDDPKKVVIVNDKTDQESPPNC